jgi:acetoin utilization deacetylase AcuC-like enzyme
MKPTRIRMCHSLVMNYGLYKKMEIFVKLLPACVDLTADCGQRAKPATKREMTQFHTDEYVDFLYRITPDNAHQFGKEQVKCEDRGFLTWQATDIQIMSGTIAPCLTDYSNTALYPLGGRWVNHLHSLAMNELIRQRALQDYQETNAT